MLRFFNHYVSARKLTLFCAESGAITVMCAAGAVLAARVLGPVPAAPLGPPAIPLLLTLALLFVPLFQLTLYFTDLYNLRVARDDRASGSGVVRAAGFSILIVGVVTPLIGLVLPPGTLIGGAVGALGGALFLRARMPTVLGEASRVLVVGGGIRARTLTNWIDDGGEGAYAVAGVIDLPEEEDVVRALQSEAKRTRADCVVVASDAGIGPSLAEALLRCRFAGLRVYDVAGFCERVMRRIPVAHLRAVDLAYADELTVSTPRKWFKRAFDLVTAGLLSLLALPILGLAALAIRLESRGPIFYRQERVGREGRVYSLWKLRSMRIDAEKDGAVWARENDDRVTRVGRFLRKTRVDEIPQVFNVLRGDMSFVGPRPERPVFVQKLKDQIPYYGFREGVKPGITGWAQIRYPYGASVEDARNKLEYDLYYVKNGSLFLDFAIIFHTIRHVLTGRGAR